MTKNEALARVFLCADLYEANLRNRNLLFICSSSNPETFAFETLFMASNFMHLTGIKLINHVHATAFYNLCLDRRLRVDDYELASDGTTDLKLDVLPKLFSVNLNANMWGDYNDRGKSYTHKRLQAVFLQLLIEKNNRDMLF